MIIEDDSVDISIDGQSLRLNALINYKNQKPQASHENFKQYMNELESAIALYKQKGTMIIKYKNNPNQHDEVEDDGKFLREVIEDAKITKFYFDKLQNMDLALFIIFLLSFVLSVLDHQQRLEINES